MNQEEWQKWIEKQNKVLKKMRAFNAVLSFVLLALMVGFFICWLDISANLNRRLITLEKKLRVVEVLYVD